MQTNESVAAIVLRNLIKSYSVKTNEMKEYEEVKTKS